MSRDFQTNLSRLQAEKVGKRFYLWKNPLKHRDCLLGVVPYLYDQRVTPGIQVESYAVGIYDRINPKKWPETMMGMCFIRCTTATNMQERLDEWATGPNGAKEGVRYISIDDAFLWFNDSGVKKIIRLKKETKKFCKKITQLLLQEVEGGE
jgi:hypothetical protein